MAKRGLPEDETQNISGIDVTSRTLGKRIKLLRTEREYSLRYLAEKADTSASTISRIENGATNVELSTIINILDVLGYSPEFSMKGFETIQSPMAVDFLRDALEVRVNYQPDTIAMLNDVIMTMRDLIEAAIYSLEKGENDG